MDINTAMELVEGHYSASQSADIRRYPRWKSS